MNFLAHAVLARRFRQNDRFVLGSVLPDLAAMAGLPYRSVVEPTVREGLDFHLVCDDLFHGDAAFRALLASSRRDLAARGLSRAPTLAATHVGVELFLDGHLGHDPVCRQTLGDALAVSVDGRELGWDEAQAARWVVLRDRILDEKLVVGYRDHHFVGERLVRILGRRPRLRIPEREVDRLLRYLPRLREATWEIAPRLLSGLEERLKSHGQNVLGSPVEPQQAIASQPVSSAGFLLDGPPGYS